MKNYLMPHQGTKINGALTECCTGERFSFTLFLDHSIDEELFQSGNHLFLFLLGKLSRNFQVQLFFEYYLRTKLFCSETFLSGKCILRRPFEVGSDEFPKPFQVELCFALRLF